MKTMRPEVEDVRAEGREDEGEGGWEEAADLRSWGRVALRVW